MQNGLLPNLRNLAVYFYTGLADKNCEPGTFLYAWDRIQELEEADPGGYADIRFKAFPGLAHAFPPGEPGKGLKWVAGRRRDPYPEKIVWEYAAHPFPLPDDRGQGRAHPAGVVLLAAVRAARRTACRSSPRARATSSTSRASPLRFPRTSRSSSTPR